MGGELKGMGKDGIGGFEGKGIEKYKLGGELKSIHFNLWHQISK